jgi:DNA-binding beta-propeller fold protein YncE
MLVKLWGAFVAEVSMRTFIGLSVFVVIVAGCSRTPTAQGADKDGQILRQVQTIELPRVEGRIDHFAADVKGKRLFMAALGNGSLEVIDTAAGRRVGSVAGLRKPQGVGFVAETGEIVVACGGDGTVRFYDAATFKPTGVVEGLEDADNVRYDAAAGRLYVGYGGGALAVVDARSRKKVGEVRLEGHPESFQLEKEGKRIFVNVPEAGHVAVVDRERGVVVAKWALGEAKANFPMALDEGNHRLMVGCRQPARVVVFDTERGKVVASVACAGDTDDVFYDAARRRVYVSGGAGEVSVVAQKSADGYEAVGAVKTAAGARTSFFVGETGRLYVAVPHRGGQVAEIRVFEVGGGK